MAHISVHVKTAGNTPWRNPITHISAAHFVDGEMSRIYDQPVTPRNNSEILVRPGFDYNFDNDKAVDEVEAIINLTTFCYSAGRGIPIVYEDISYAYEFIRTAVSRRNMPVAPPDHIVCLRTFGILLDAHKRVELNGLSAKAIYDQLYPEPCDIGTPAEHATCIGYAYGALVKLAGWV